MLVTATFCCILLDRSLAGLFAAFTFVRTHPFREAPRFFNLLSVLILQFQLEIDHQPFGADLEWHHGWHITNHTMLSVHLLAFVLVALFRVHVRAAVASTPLYQRLSGRDSGSQCSWRANSTIGENVLQDPCGSPNFVRSPNSSSKIDVVQQSLTDTVDILASRIMLFSRTHLLSGWLLWIPGGTVYRL